MRKIIFLSSLLTFLFTSSIWAADISGTWVLKYTGHQGDDRVLDMVVTASGENLTVATTHPSLGEMTGTGTLAENEITMTLAATGEQKVTFELNGTVAGNKMSGTRKVTMSQEGGQDGPPAAEGRAASNKEDASSQSKRSARPESASSDTKETSNTWTAEKK